MMPISSLARELLLGLEPRTSSLPRKRSTTELQQPDLGLWRPAQTLSYEGRYRSSLASRRGKALAEAGEGNRTLNDLLGRQVLYH